MFIAQAINATAIAAAVVAAFAGLVYVLLVPVRDALVRWLDKDGNGKVDPDETAPLHEGPLSRVDAAELAASWLATSEGAAEAARIAKEHKDDPKALLLALLEAIRRDRQTRARSPLAVTVILGAICAMSACASPVVLVLGATVDGRAELSAQVEGFDVPLELVADGSGSAALRWDVGTLDAELTADAGVCAMAKLGPWVLAAETCVETGD